ncbi:MAG TPA: phage tail sheath subtilisin-like domain-containing protein [Chthoniobacteraceae bacterium]|nr:phage tail sheath subtilisin-like domain-containing protein [Chthoniobacteraceae bacterium]
MPEYLAPGVYVEETSFRAKSIEGVGTSTSAFVGATLRGPVAPAVGATEAPVFELLTSFNDFVRIFGGLEPLGFAPAQPNYLAHAVLNFFNEGGSRLYVARVQSGAAPALLALRGAGPADAERVFVRSRFPGAGGNGRLIVREILTPANLGALGNAPAGALLRASTDGGGTFSLFGKQTAGPAGAWAAADGTAFPLPADPAAIVGNLLSLSLVVEDRAGESEVFDEVSFVRGDPRYVSTALAGNPRTRDEQMRQVFAFDIGDNVSAFELREALFSGTRVNGGPTEGFTAVHTIGSGLDGIAPAAPNQAGIDGAAPTGGAPNQPGTYAAALQHLLSLEDVSIVAAPGHSAYADFQNIQGLLRSHVERPRAYRIGVLDTPPNLTPSQARLERARIDSSRLALYYPWVTVSNPLARPGRDDVPREINLPPSGFLCGIYARNDTLQSVAKAPANEVVNGALRFERDVNHAENQLLNPVGVNCLRYLSGRGYRVWGARTASSDPEFKYVNVRRFFLYLEASIDRGTQWAVFENNGPRLWANVRETVESFLYNEWVSGNLLGATPKEAFFVRCDRSTMTQNDLDNGRLICLVGVAALKPAEFVIFRIGQKTADERT